MIICKKPTLHVEDILSDVEHFLLQNR